MLWHEPSSPSRTRIPLLLILVFLLFGTLCASAAWSLEGGGAKISRAQRMDPTPGGGSGGGGGPPPATSP